MKWNDLVIRRIGWTLQGILWIGLAIYFSLPQLDWTLGVFQSKDGSVIVPIIYGSIINAILFYGNAYYLMDAFLAKRKYLKYWSILIAGFFGLSLLESALDVGWLIYFYDAINKADLEEIVWGNLFLNGIFFVVISIFYRFALDWVKLNSQTLKSNETPKIDQNEIILIKTGKTHHKIRVNSIEFIESDGNDVKYHCSGEIITLRDSLTRLHKELPADQFVRCHKSYIISKQHVNKIDYDYIYLPSQQIPIGRAFRENVNQIFS